MNNQSSDQKTIFMKIVSYLIIMSLMMNPLIVYSASSVTSKEAAYKASISRLDDLMGKFSELRNHIDRSQFDLKILLKKLESNPDKIANFVTKDIYFEQYEGLLRGEQGTLMSRAGNALDQAVLLSTLLKHAGMETSIKRATLSDQQAKILLKQLSVTKTAVTSAFKSNQSSKEVIRQILKTTEIPKNKLELIVEKMFKQADIKASDVYKDAKKDANFITDFLAKNNQSIKQKDITNELLKEAKDYFWVEYKTKSSNSFKSVHPALGGYVKSFEKLDVVNSYTEKKEIPKNLQHRFRFQAFLEQKKENKLIVAPLMKTWEQPVDSLIGKQLTFQNQPDGLKKLLDLKKPENISTKTKVLIPVLRIDGKVAIDIPPFDLTGTILDKSAISEDGAVKTTASNISNSMNGIGGMLSNIGSTIGGRKEDKKAKEEVKTELTSLWIKYTLIAPGGKEKITKRYIIDRIGAENRQNQLNKLDKFTSKAEAIWKLAETSQFILSPNHYPDSYIFDRYLQRMITAQDALELSVKMSYFPDTELSLTKKQLAGFNDPLTLWLTSGIDKEIPLDAGDKSYQSEPFLLISKSTLIYKNKKSTTNFTVDIANRGQRIIRTIKDRIVTTPQTAILLGTWATRLEEINTTKKNDKTFKHWNTREAFKVAKEKKISLMLISPKDQQKLKNVIGLSTALRKAIKSDLDNGNIIIIAQKLTSDDPRAGWWRVNSETGVTLGMINNGLGGDFIEVTIINAASIGIGLFISAIPLANCLQNEKCSSKGCLAAAAAGFAVGFFMGFLLGKIISSYIGANGINLITGYKAGIELVGGIYLGIGGFLFPSCADGDFPNIMNKSQIK